MFFGKKHMTFAEWQGVKHGITFIISSNLIPVLHDCFPYWGWWSVILLTGSLQTTEESSSIVALKGFMTLWYLFSNIWLELCFLPYLLVGFMIYFVLVYCNNNCHLLLSMFFPLYIKTKITSNYPIVVSAPPTSQPPPKKHIPQKLPTNSSFPSKNIASCQLTEMAGGLGLLMSERWDLKLMTSLIFLLAELQGGWGVSQHWGFLGLGEWGGRWFCRFEQLKTGPNGWFGVVLGMKY